MDCSFVTRHSPLRESRDDTPCTVCKVPSFTCVIVTEKTQWLQTSGSLVCFECCPNSFCCWNNESERRQVTSKTESTPLFPTVPCVLPGALKMDRGCFTSLCLGFLKTHFIPSRGELSKPCGLHPCSVLAPAVPAS